MWLSRFFLNGVLALAIPGAACAAKLYKWVDEKGQVHYSESIPPQYRDKANTEIDRRGRILRKNEALAEQKRQAEEDVARKQAEEKRLTERARRDKALLETYTNEAEIDLARDRNIAFPKQVMESYEPRIKTGRQRGEALRAEREGLAKAGKPVPAALDSDIAAAEKDLNTLMAELKSKQAEIEQISERFAAQKARYRELTDAAASSGSAARSP